MPCAQARAGQPSLPLAPTSCAGCVLGAMLFSQRWAGSVRSILGLPSVESYSVRQHDGSVTLQGQSLRASP
eukprot:3978614-Alexandrium_andersonii.AAC.1